MNVNVVPSAFRRTLPSPFSKALRSSYSPKLSQTASSVMLETRALTVLDFFLFLTKETLRFSAFGSHLGIAFDGTATTNIMFERWNSEKSICVSTWLSFLLSEYMSSMRRLNHLNEYLFCSVSCWKSLCMSSLSCASLAEFCASVQLLVIRRLVFEDAPIAGRYGCSVNPPLKKVSSVAVAFSVL